MHEELVNKFVMRHVMNLSRVQKPEFAEESVRCLKWVIAYKDTPVIARIRAENALNTFGRKFDGVA